MATAIVPHHGAHVFGNSAQVAQQIFRGVFAQFRMLFNCAVQVVNVSGVMLVMVQLHGFGVDVRLKRSIVVGKWWQFVSQNILLEFVPDSGVLRLGKPTAGKSVWRNGCASLPSPYCVSNV